MTSLLCYLGGCLLLAGLPVSLALAQPQPVGLPVDPMPFFPERTGDLAATSQVPAAYELFVPDTSVQILFNPARAVRAASSWGWVTYNRTPVQLYQSPYGAGYYQPQQIDGSTLAGAWLRRQQRGAWLLQAGLSVATQQDEHDQHTEQDESSVTVLDRQQSTEFRENVAQRWGVRMRLSRSWEGRQGGGHALEAFGFVGSINQEHVNRRHSLRVRTQQGSTGGAYHHRSVTEHHDVREDKVTPVVLGLGYSRTTARSDWIMTLSYQQATNPRDASSANTSTSTDSVFNAQGEVEHVHESTTHSMIESRGSMEPRTVVGSFYTRHRMGWLQEDDHVFVTAISLGGWGSQSYHFETSELQFVQEDDSILVEESTQAQDDGRDDLWSWNVQGGVGYGIEAAYGAVSLFSGPSLWAEYGRAAHVQEVEGSQIRLYDEETVFHGSVFWPVYVHYCVSEAVRLFGGLTYAYGFGRWEGAGRIVQRYSHMLTLEQRFDQVTKRSALTRSTFLGAIIALPSGLAAQFAFNGNLAAYTNWTISLGWRY